MKGYGKIWIIPRAALLCACSNGNDTAQPVRSVYVTQPVKISNERVKSYPGIVKAAEEINLGFKTAGQIEKILVKEGDFVHKGQLLAELDSADYRLAVEALQIQYDQLRDEVERTAQLFSRKSKENINYDLWVQSGFVKVTPGNVLDYDFVKADILGIVEKYDFRSCAYDRWNSSQTIIDLQNEGLECTPFGQGYGSMSAPSKEFEKLVLSGRVEHYGNPVLRWMLASTVIKTDPAGNIKPDKEKSVQKIDGIVAAIMALGEWMTAQAEGDNDPYSRRGMLNLGE